MHRMLDILHGSERLASGLGKGLGISFGVVGNFRHRLLDERRFLFRGGNILGHFGPTCTC